MALVSAIVSASTSANSISTPSVCSGLLLNSNRGMGSSCEVVL